MATKTDMSADVGRRLKGLREGLGIPKERIALEMAMSAENWRHYESGRNQLAVTQLPKLAEILDMSLADLVVALFDLREICNSPSTSDSKSDDRIHANYNYTDDAKRLSGLARPPARSFVLATAV